MAPFPMSLAMTMKNCWRVVGTKGHSKEDLNTVMRLLADDKVHIADLNTDRFKLKDAEMAIENMEKRKEVGWMMVLNP